ncbi:hypothetical protein XGA_3704, partial [Xanthomonas hortorum ATCC 19865]
PPLADAIRTGDADTALALLRSGELAGVHFHEDGEAPLALGRDALLARGRAFGDSRLVCNVHWQSDVIQGRMMAAATVAALHDNPEFQKDLAAARREIAQASAKKPATTALSPTCDAENAALQTVLPDVM